MNVIICDDDIHELHEVSRFCSSNFPEICIEAYESSVELINNLENGNVKPDVFILDIEMPELTGLDLKKIIASKYSNADIIFLTSHTEMMENAFGRNVVAFIQKSNWKERLTEELDRILNESVTMILLENSKQVINIPVKRIISLNAADYYSEICYMSDGINCESSVSFLCNKSLKKWEDCLASDTFYRISRAVIVNMENILYVQGNTVSMVNGDNYAIPKGKIKTFRHQYFEYIKRNERIL